MAPLLFVLRCRSGQIYCCATLCVINVTETLEILLQILPSKYVGEKKCVLMHYDYCCSLRLNKVLDYVGGSATLTLWLKQHSGYED